jgi:hypothetical protein
MPEKLPRLRQQPPRNRGYQVSEFAASAAEQLFRPMPGHNPRSKQERNRRVHYYVSHLGSAASSQLRQALVILRNAADQMPDASVQQAARKSFSEAEFAAAIKELVCIWIHQEAVEQGSDAMPTWLINFFKLAEYASDFLIPQPPAAQILLQHAHLEDAATLRADVALTIARYLGFGDASTELGQALEPLLSVSRARQKVLRDALTMEFD